MTPETPGLTQRHKLRPWGGDREQGEKKNQNRRNVFLFVFNFIFKEATKQIMTVIGIDLTEEHCTKFRSLHCAAHADKADPKRWERKSRLRGIQGKQDEALSFFLHTLVLPTYKSFIPF